MRLQKLSALLVLFFTFIPFVRAFAQSPSPTPLPDNTEIMNSIPGLTAFTDNSNKEKQASDGLGIPTPFTAAVMTIMSFGIDKKSTFVNFEQEAAILGQAYDKDQPGGGKLMPKMKQDELIKPQYREDANHTEQFASVFCSNLSNQEKQKKINELMAVTERVPVAYYDSYWETSMHASVNGTNNGIKSTKFYAPPQDFFTYDPATDNYILKPEHEGALYDCGAQSVMNKTSEVPIQVFGNVTSNSEPLKIEATPAMIWDFLTGLYGCLTNPQECANRYMQLTTQVTYTAILPFAPDMYAKATGGMRNYTNFPPGAPADKVALLKKEKGVYNIYYPKSYIDKYLTIGYDDSHAGTTRPASANTDVQASPLEGAVGPTKIPHAGEKAVKLRFAHAVSCPIQPKMKQDDSKFDCSARPINISDWAINPDGRDVNPRFNPPPPTQGSIQEAIVQGVKKVGIPQCVLEGVAQIEGAYGWQPNDTRITECRPNVCSATGPFQITIGRDANGDRMCPSCPSKWVEQYGCPNTWGSDPESPCNYAHAAERAAQILKAKAGYQGYTLGPGDPRSQQQAIMVAGYGYYGSNTPIDRLGGCSYGEFVYQHCDPSYQCKAAQ